MTFRDTMIGSCCIFMGHLLWATNDAIIKISDIKLSQLMIGRFTIALIIATLWWNIKKPSSFNHWYGDQPYTRNIWIRGLMNSIMVVFLWYGIITLPLGDAYCILNQSPLLTAILAAIFLKERLPKLTPIIALLAITGILCLSQPTWLTSGDGSPLNFGGLMAMIMSVIAWSISCVLVRTIKESHFLQMNIVSSGVTIFISLPILLLVNEYLIKNERIGDYNTNDWEWDAKAIGIMIGIGVQGFAAVCFNVVGYQYADATKVGWLEYMAIVFTFIYQVWLFEDIPDIYEIIGAILVIVACSMSVLEEFYYYYHNSDHLLYDHLSESFDASHVEDP